MHQPDMRGKPHTIGLNMLFSFTTHVNSSPPERLRGFALRLFP
jgi:hypothetical protein